MAQYKLHKDGQSIIRDDGAFIPADPLNRDYADYLAWVADGNTADPADVPDPKLAIQAEIDTLEASTYLTRGARELHLRLMLQDAQAQATAQNTTVDAVLATVPYYGKLKAIDEQVAALRSQLK